MTINLAVLVRMTELSFIDVNQAAYHIAVSAIKTNWILRINGSTKIMKTVETTFRKRMHWVCRIMVIMMITPKMAVMNSLARH